MKYSHRLKSRTAGPIWGIALGFVLTLAGVVLWCYGEFSASANSKHEHLAVAAVLIGVFATIYAAHELRHQWTILRRARTTHQSDVVPTGRKRHTQ